MTISFVVFAMSMAISLDDPIQRSALERLRWLAGCWEMRRDDRITEEQWMLPRGGVMMGMSRTVRGDSLIELESKAEAAISSTLLPHCDRQPRNSQDRQQQAATCRSRIRVTTSRRRSHTGSRAQTLS